VNGGKESHAKQVWKTEACYLSKKNMKHKQNQKREMRKEKKSLRLNKNANNNFLTFFQNVYYYNSKSSFIECIVTLTDDSANLGRRGDATCADIFETLVGALSFLSRLINGA
jgi:hypothetical protein